MISINSYISYIHNING